MRKIIPFTTVMLVFACPSCDSRNRLYPVSGKVTYHGSPASGAVVYFRRRDADASAATTIMGVVKQDGSFELVCGALGKGAPPGNYDVLIEWKRTTGQGRRRPQIGPDVLQGRYANSHRPVFHLKLDAAATTLAPFQLE